MGRRTVVEAFISSPGDCTRERAALHEAIDDYNRVAVAALDLEVRGYGPAELYPAHGSYAQEGVNRQLGRHELHVALWRESAGTPTPNAPSGTVEELRLALARRAQTRRPWVMAYFWKDSRTDFTPTKDLLKAHGWYYHDYADAAQLGRLFTQHLSGYLRDAYRLPGHSTTQLGPAGDDATAAPVVLTFRVRSPGITERIVTFQQRVVTVGREPERSDIVLTSQRVHREQGSFIHQGGEVCYVDVAGDSRREPDPRQGPAPVVHGLQTVRIGDAIVLPDGTQIVLCAIV